METTLKLVSVADFYHPAHATLYSTMVDMWEVGKPLDAQSMASELKQKGELDNIGGPVALMDLQSGTPATSSAGNYAKIIVKMATFRRAIAVATDLANGCYEQSMDPFDLMEHTIANLKQTGVRIDEVPSDLWVLDEFLDRPEAIRPEWIIPGIIRKGWRIVVVAGEGVGKTVLFRQLGMAAAQGIHPLRFSKMEPCRTLIVDLENPEDSILDVCNPIRDRIAGNTNDYDPERAWLWHRPAGINVRSRSDRIALESVIARTRPDLVCLGPLYKAYEVTARENDELAAREVMRVLDDLRTRYNFGLMMEHHAPKESGGSKRKMMPYGTSLWLRWPEMGVALQPEGEGLETLTVGRWRGDRLQNDWPSKLHRSQTWPWQGEFDLPMARPAAHRTEIRPERVNDFVAPPVEEDPYELDEPF